mmetsp:Transcript_26545/g.61990  ORF Transcript_26545/g.61990 Transcript_26545/m.61990 type:complete len:1143 (+) Transcript_26545:186-3614(+)
MSSFKILLLLFLSAALGESVEGGCPSSCSTHGKCVNGICRCAAGWSGQDCSFFLVAGSDAELDDDAIEDDVSCASGCSMHGTCIGGQCHCHDGWSGIACNVPSGCTSPCGSHGRCIAGVCSCEVGFFGPTCEDQQCPHDCNGHGDCVKGSCHCHAGWSGRACDFEAPPPATPPAFTGCSAQSCGARRRCVEGQCECDAGFTGSDCNTPVSVTPEADSAVGLTGFSSNSSLRGGSPPSGQEPPAMESALDAVRLAVQEAGTAAERLRVAAGGQAQAGASVRTAAASHLTSGAVTGVKRTPPPLVLPKVAETKALQEDPDHEDALPVRSSWQVPVRPSKTLLQAQRSKKQGVHLLTSSAALVASHDGALQESLCEANCTGHGTCSTNEHGVHTCACNLGWVGSICDTPSCPDDCHGNGMCIGGHCVCNEGWFGDSCGQPRCPNDCSGNGYCFQAKCQCKTGFEGPSCALFKKQHQTLTLKLAKAPPRHAPGPVERKTAALSLRVLQAPQCKDNCNQRGTCGADGKCICATGYGGETCESYCPNECSHQGQCMEGACLCFAGYFGDDCSHQGCCNGHGSCDDPGTCQCDPGWAGDECDVQLVCPSQDCSGHGTCSFGLCTCMQGFQGPNCAMPTHSCSPPCGPHGICNPTANQCECEAGFFGPSCTSTLQSCPSDCNNRGLCLNGKCMCGPAWTGADCSQRFFEPGKPIALAAAPPWVGQGGNPEAVAMAFSGFSTGASANANPQAQAAVKRLTATTGGVVCGDGGLCSGHGTCDTAAGVCHCNSGFGGDTCEEQRCPSSADGQECAGHGMCQAGQCQCVSGWGLAPGKSAPNVCEDLICPLGCGEHGLCVSGQCQCQAGFTGPLCRDPQCPQGCSGHGQCSFVQANSPGQCVCDYGWGGAGCERQALYDSVHKCPQDCSGNGLCMNGLCMCNVGFEGQDCSTLVGLDASETGVLGGSAPTCANNCSNHGSCTNGACACEASYTGIDCSMPLQCQESCGEACASRMGPGAPASETCTLCIGQCTTLLNHPVLGAHNPFEDLQATLVQMPQGSRSPDGVPKSAALLQAHHATKHMRHHREQQQSHHHAAVHHHRHLLHKVLQKRHRPTSEAVEIGENQGDAAALLQQRRHHEVRKVSRRGLRSLHD